MNQFMNKIEIVNSENEFSIIEKYIFKLNGIDDFGSLFNKVLKSASEKNIGICFLNDFVLATSVQIVIPKNIKYFNCPNLTIKQLDNSNLESVVKTENFGNNYGEYKIRIDANREKNESSVGFMFGGSCAGSRFKFDLTFLNCKKGLYIDKEIEHCNFDIYGQNNNNLVIIDTETNTADENSFKIFSHESETIFKTIGKNKSSGTVEIHAEQNSGWSIDLENGWFDFRGIVRSTGKFHGGGIKLSKKSGHVSFNNFQIYGDPDATAVQNTVGLMIDTRTCEVSGNIKFGAFGSHVLAKHYNQKSDLKINAVSKSYNGETLKLGDFEKRLLADAGKFTVTNEGVLNGFSAINFEYATNVVVDIPTCLNGGNEEILISQACSKNVISLSPKTMKSRITNNRIQNDNLIL